MFPASSAHLQEDTAIHMQPMVMSLSTGVPGDLSVHTLKLCTDRLPGPLIESDNTVCCMYTTVSS